MLFPPYFVSAQGYSNRAEPGVARRRDAERAVVRAAAHPAVLEHRLGERGSERAREMRAFLAPIEAGAGEDALAGAGPGDVDAELGEERLAGVGQLERAVEAAENVPR